MRSQFIEATQGQTSWSQFQVQQLDPVDWAHQSEVSQSHLLASQGHDPNILFVMDLETCEGVIYSPNGDARSFLRKHQVWVSPLFGPFLNWLSDQMRLSRAAGTPFDVCALPSLINLDMDQATSGRNEGPMDFLLKKCLTSADKETRDLARTLWVGLHGDQPVPGVPPTLEQFKAWSGTHLENL